MKNYIAVHKKENYSKVLLNIRWIETVTAHEISGSWIHLYRTIDVCVKESVDEIEKLIAKAEQQSQ